MTEEEIARFVQVLKESERIRAQIAKDEAQEEGPYAGTPARRLGSVGQDARPPERRVE